MQGAWVVLAASAAFAMADVAAGRLGAGLPLALALFVRYGVQAISTGLWVATRPSARLWRTQQPGFQLTRGCLLLAVTAFGFSALRHLRVAEFTAIAMTTPMAVMALSAFALKERPTAAGCWAVGAAFIGTVIVVRPGLDGFNFGSYFALAMVACNAAFQVLTRRMAREDHPATMHLYTGVIGTVIASAFLDQSVMLVDFSTWGILMLMGAGSTIGHLLLIIAYKQAPAVHLAPFMYSQIPFAALGAWLVMHQVPDVWTSSGIALISLSGCAVAVLAMLEEKSSKNRPLLR